jgi:hypothetical protein
MAVGAQLVGNRVELKDVDFDCLDVMFATAHSRRAPWPVAWAHDMDPVSSRIWEAMVPLPGGVAGDLPWAGGRRRA